MKANLFTICFFYLITYFISAQNYEDDTLLTINENPVKVSEFLRVYRKNLNLVKDNSQKDIEAYLKLFINYKLKVEEARRLGYDKKENLQKELKKYREQLAKNYLADNEVTESLVKEAYERSAYRIKASHVLVALPEYEQDTLETYNKISALRERLVNEGFETLKKDVHDGETIYVEDLGYFSTFNMVYDFENAAYHTQVGEISRPFRTQFGYHVVQVFDKQKSKGEVTIGHIVISKNQKDSNINPEQRINEIYDLIQQGQSFEDLAKQFSEDKNSARKGGKLGTIKEGVIRVKIFEDVAFSLTKTNNISTPFETDRSWHIVKLYDKKPFGSYNDLKNGIEKEVKRNGRSARINSALITFLLKRYNVSYEQSELSYFNSKLDENYFEGNWTIPYDLPKDKVLFSVKEQNYTFNDFAIFLKQNYKQYQVKNIDVLLETAYKKFVDDTVFKYHKNHLEVENPDFANLLLEFEEGLLLFEFMDNKVWNIANTDSLGLREFYEENKSNYTQKSTIDAIIATSINPASLEKIKKLLEKYSDVKSLRDALKEEVSVILTHKTLEKGDSFLPEDFKFEKGISQVFEANNTFHIIRTNNIVPERIKEFNEVKGIVINDYQNFIEEKLIQELADKYKINVDKNVLNIIKSQLN